MARLLLVLVASSLLGAVVAPRFQERDFRRRTSGLVRDVQELRDGILAYRAERGAWPEEVGPGLRPPGLKDLLPREIHFSTPEFRLDYEHRAGSGVFQVALAVITEDEKLGLAFLEALGPGTYLAGSRYAWIIVP